MRVDLSYLKKLSDKELIKKYTELEKQIEEIKVVDGSDPRITIGYEMDCIDREIQRRYK